MTREELQQVRDAFDLACDTTPGERTPADLEKIQDAFTMLVAELKKPEALEFRVIYGGTKESPHYEIPQYCASKVDALGAALQLELQPPFWFESRTPAGPWEAA